MANSLPVRLSFFLLNVVLPSNITQRLRDAPRFITSTADVLGIDPNDFIIQPILELSYQITHLQ